MLIYWGQEIHLFLEQVGKALHRPQWNLMIAGLFTPS
jgi:hypothetical protein